MQDNTTMLIPSAAEAGVVGHKAQIEQKKDWRVTDAIQALENSHIENTFASVLFCWSVGLSLSCIHSGSKGCNIFVKTYWDIWRYIQEIPASNWWNLASAWEWKVCIYFCKEKSWGFFWPTKLCTWGLAPSHALVPGSNPCHRECNLWCFLLLLVHSWSLKRPVPVQSFHLVLTFQANKMRIFVLKFSSQRHIYWCLTVWTGNKVQRKRVVQDKPRGSN